MAYPMYVALQHNAVSRETL